MPPLGIVREYQVPQQLEFQGPLTHKYSPLLVFLVEVKVDQLQCQA